RRLAGAANGEIADGNDLHTQSGVAEHTDIVEETAGLDCNLENFGKREQSGTDDGGPGAAAVFKNNFKDEGFNGFGPRSNAFTHVGPVCPCGWGEASGQGCPAIDPCIARLSMTERGVHPASPFAVRAALGIPPLAFRTVKPAQA